MIRSERTERDDQYSTHQRSTLVKDEKTVHHLRAFTLSARALHPIMLADRGTSTFSAHVLASIVDAETATFALVHADGLVRCGEGFARRRSLHSLHWVSLHRLHWVSHYRCFCQCRDPKRVVIFFSWLVNNLDISWIIGFLTLRAQLSLCSLRLYRDPGI